MYIYCISFSILSIYVFICSLNIFFVFYMLYIKYVFYVGVYISVLLVIFALISSLMLISLKFFPVNFLDDPFYLLFLLFFSYVPYYILSLICSPLDVVQFSLYFIDDFFLYFWTNIIVKYVFLFWVAIFFLMISIYVSWETTQTKSNSSLIL